MKTAAVILTGGLSRRMGRDKCGLELEGETFLERLISRCRENFDQVCVSVDRPGRFPTAGAEEICDLRPGNQGPLAGLEAAFLQTGAELLFLTAVDLPFGEPALARRMLELLGTADACCIRRKDGRLETLFAVYDRACLEQASACLDQGRRSFRSMLDWVNCRVVEEDELPEFDLDRILMNVNRPEDLELARQLTEFSLL